LSAELLAALVGAIAVLVGLPGRAVAHIEVVPADSPAGAMERYGIRVPTEKAVPTVRVEVEFPSGLRVLDIQASPGWQVTVQTESGGRPVGATWDGSSIPAGQFAEFGLRAQNPDGEAQLHWSVIQTYADGSEVQWIGPATAEFPAATTRVRGGRLIESLDPLSGASGVLALCALVISTLAWRARRRTG
jgi:uncharacterized protein YcnI